MGLSCGTSFSCWISKGPKGLDLALQVVFILSSLQCVKVGSQSTKLNLSYPLKLQNSYKIICAYWSKHSSTRGQ